MRHRRAFPAAPVQEPPVPDIDLSANRIVDISQQITHGMWDYKPLDVPTPSVEVTPIATIADNGYNLHKFLLNGLTGTYIESARHMNPDAPYLDKFHPRTLIRPAKILRLPPAEPYRLYTVEDLEKANPGIEEGDAMIMVTGWDSERDNLPDYITKGPAFSYSTLEWFMKQPFSIWATDITVANCLWAEEQGLKDEVGKDLLKDMYDRKPDMRILAPLCNVAGLKGDVGTLIALGINIPDVCAVPARVLFVEGAVLRT
jgi:kynurenine formamidase